jgi:hypothetical protein
LQNINRNEIKSIIWLSMLANNSSKVQTN